MHRFQEHLPQWMQEWLELLIPAAQIFAIVFVAWLIYRACKRLIRRVGAAYNLPHSLLLPVLGLVRWVIIGIALLSSLQRLGMSGTVLWTAFTGFATVGAVAFFAAWSVLSNLFCSVLIVTVGPFRLGDHIELIDSADKPGAKGRVIDLNLLYTTLQDDNAPPGAPCLLQIPNSLIFQRVVRRWKEGMPMTADEPTAATGPEEAGAMRVATPAAIPTAAATQPAAAQQPPQG